MAAARPRRTTNTVPTTTTPHPPAHPKKVKIKLLWSVSCHICPDVHLCIDRLRIALWSRAITISTVYLRTKQTHDAYIIKDIATDLPKREEWAATAPDIMWDLNDAKYSRNPDLKKQLLDIAPHKLIEA